MKKAYTKILCLILSAIMVIGILPIVNAFDPTQFREMQTSPDSKWLYDTGDDEEGGVYRYLGSEENVEIPEEIEGIKIVYIYDNCFYGRKRAGVSDTENFENNDNIKSISIPPSIASVGDCAFAYMDSLEEVTFSRPELGKLELNSNLFEGSPMLNNIVLPDYCHLSLGSFLSESYIKELKISSLNHYSNAQVGIPLCSVESLTFTDKYAFGSFKSIFADDSLKTIEFTESVILNSNKTVSFEFSDDNGNDNKPDLIFHHIPSAALEDSLLEYGYIKEYDYETGFTVYSVNNIQDTKYIPVTDENGILNIYQFGEFDYALTLSGDAVVTAYNGNADTISFPPEIDGHAVTALGATGYTIDTGEADTIIIPDSVEYIAKNAFCNNKSLKNIQFSEKLKTIETGAFKNCSLNEVVLPNVTYIGASAFEKCKPERVFIPSTLKEIPSEMFYSTSRDNKEISEVIISEGVESIGNRAFYYFGSNADDGFELVLPSTLKSIESGAFYFAGITGELVIPPEIKVLKNRTFLRNNISSVSLPDGLECIYAQVFNELELSQPLVIPESVVYLDTRAFSHTDAPEIILNAKIKYIPYECFLGSTIGRLIIPDSVKVIDERAFCECTINELTLPKELKYYGYDSFKSSKINTLIYRCERFSENYDLQFDPIDSKIVNLVIDETVDELPPYLFSFADISGDVTVLSGLKAIGEYAFAFSTIKNITIPETVQSIGNNAFASSPDLEKVTFAAENCSIADCAFEDCPLLTEFVFSEGVKRISSGILKKVTNVDTVTVPSSVESIGNGAFSECSALETVNFNAGDCIVDANGEYPFENCPNLREFNFGDNIRYIPDNLLRNSGGLESVNIPEGVTDIGSYTFAGTNLKSIVLPDSLESIGDNCFENCKELETVVINGYIFIIGDNTFKGCGKLKEIYISDTVYTIGRNSFAGCISLETVYMSKNVVYIPERCFENCTALTSFTWEADSKLIGKLAFAGCTSLTTFNFEGIKKLYPNSFKGSGIGVASLGEAQDEAAAALEIVEAQSFMDCPKLQTVALGGNVNTVQTRAFANCENLETAIISDSVETIAPDAFENCPKLTIYCSESSYAYNYATSNDIKVSTFVVEPIPNQKYTGRVIEPEVKVSLSGNPLARNEDFRVRYTDNVNVGTAAAKVSGINDYKMFTSTVHFAIISRNISEAEIGSIADQSYKGGEVTPKVKVTYNGKTLREGTDYNVIYTSNDSAGTAKATIIGTGNYSGTHTVTFNIVESPAGDNPADEPGNNPEENTSFIRTVLNFFMRIIAAFRNLFAGFFTV